MRNKMIVITFYKGNFSKGVKRLNDKLSDDFKELKLERFFPSQLCRFISELFCLFWIALATFIVHFHFHNFHLHR